MVFEKISEKPWAYTLYKFEDGGFVLSVLCGGAAMYEINIPLDNETAAKAIGDEVFLGKCASNIRDHPALYSDQHIRM